MYSGSHDRRFPLRASTPPQIWTLLPRQDQYDAAVSVIRLRESLRSYVADLSLEHSATGMPMMRPMWLAFPGDAGCVSPDTDLQFMFGSDWLVAPVLAAGVTSMSVYLPALPANQSWVYWWNATSVGSGGARVEVATSIAEFPLFKVVRASDP